MQRKIISSFSFPTHRVNLSRTFTTKYPPPIQRHTCLLYTSDSADTILGNCDTTLFLGGKEKTTLNEMSELLGKETIDLYNTSETRSNQKSFGLNYQKTGKQLMTEDEICLLYTSQYHQAQRRPFCRCRSCLPQRNQADK